MSEVAICNRALQMLGADSIIDLTEDKKSARAMNIAYRPVRDAELRRRKWRFSLRRATLAASAVAPDSDFARQFPVPTDFLRLVSGGSLGSYPDLSDFRGASNELYSLEGRMILTQLGAPLKIRYIAQIVDTSQFDAAFAEAFAARLAMETCEAITQSDSKRQLAAAQYKQALSEARTANALEGTSHSIADDTWVTARAG